MSNFFDDQELGDATFLPSPEDLFSIFDALENLKEAATTVVEDQEIEVTGKLSSSSCQDLSETDLEVEVEGDNSNEEQPKRKKAKIRVEEDDETKGNVGCGEEGSGRMSHITVERNRRKQMNEHLSILRSLMPCFYVKRGDQASIIGGVVDYINELQQVLQSLEAKKQRKSYTYDVLSPRLVTSPRLMSPTIHSPRKPPLSPRLNIPISPRTPQPGSPYIPRLTNLSPTMASPIDLSPASSSSSPHLLVNDSFANELVANSKSPVAEVEVKFSGSNLLLKTVSPRIPGQVVKIIAAIEKLCLEILEISISNIEDTMLNSFTIKIGIECQLSAEELAQQIQQTFCSTPLLI